MRRRYLLLPLLLLAGCVPEGPDSGTGVGNPDLTSSPHVLALGATCPGGTRRASLLLTNHAPWDVDAMAGGTAGVEAYPSTFEVDAHGTSELLVVIQVPEKAAERAKGEIRVRHRREGVEEESDPLVVAWSVDVSRPRTPAATVLCGEVIACASLDFGTVFTGAVWQQPLEVVNDGCAPLRVERIELEGADLAVAGPALPVTLQPGQRWQGSVLYDPGPQGARQGSVTVVTDDAEKPAQPIGWSAQVR